MVILFLYKLAVTFEAKFAKFVYNFPQYENYFSIWKNMDSNRPNFLDENKKKE